ncbi:shikimate kinase [Planomonospora corallina]|uniref:Shikimate kinase n=1 Tax=Planomonospora corallina TaxID=1806052 RepID=A0ABV8IIB9_9ACTN
MHPVPWMVLIGPAAAGKSTIGDGSATVTGRAFIDVDDLGETYYAEVGWSMDRLRNRIRAVGRAAAEQEWEPARAHAVERVVADHPGAIVSLGAGHSHYTRPELFRRVQAALRPVGHVVLVLPALDPERSVEVLRQRSITAKGTDWIGEDGHDFLRRWVHHPGNRTLATTVLCTEGEEPEQSVGRLMSTCG